ncbi:MAG: 6-phosphogluconolactonase [Candidatus Gracilibacteria bacterium]|nr:6-phosphogluconolactonase [Candidatus Gracilibacteria bacterium]
MQIIHSSNPVNLTQEVTGTFFRILQTIGEKQSIVTIGLSGGTSLQLFYGNLRDSFSSVDVKLRKKIRFVFLDERLVPLDHPDSNYRLLSEILFAPLTEKHLLSTEQILSIRTDIENSERDYFFRVPSIDIGFFGVGSDGHIASLFPHHRGLQDKSHGYILIHDSPKPPSDRISVSVSFTQKIPLVFVFFIGEGKREAYNRFFDAGTPKEQCPAKYLLGCKDCRIVTDLEE